MTDSVALIGGCAVVTVAIKAAGPVTLGGRELAPWFSSVVTLLAPALLAALVVTATLADGRHLTVGPQTAGVAVGALVAWRTGSIIGCVVVAATLAAALRLL